MKLYGLPNPKRESCLFHASPQHLCFPLNYHGMLSELRRNEAPNGGAISNFASISFVSEAKLVMEDNISLDTVSIT